MEIEFEFVAAVREKAGTSARTVEVKQADHSIFVALEQLETAMSGSGLHLIDEKSESVRKDILVFIKDRNGKQKRVANLRETPYKVGETIILASAMGGG